MVLNESKTKTMLVAGKRLHKKMSSTSLTIRVNSVELEQVQSQKLLGVIIDSRNVERRTRNCVWIDFHFRRRNKLYCFARNSLGGEPRRLVKIYNLELPFSCLSMLYNISFSLMRCLLKWEFSLVAKFSSV